MINFQKQDNKNNIQIDTNLWFQMFLQNIRFNLNFHYKKLTRIIAWRLHVSLIQFCPIFQLVVFGSNKEMRKYKPC